MIVLKNIQYGRYKRDKKLKPSDFTHYLSIVAIVKNEAPYIAEWIEYHLLVGVEKFYIYDNESTDNLKEILEPYINEGIVGYTFYPGRKKQIPAYDDAVERLKYTSYWVAVIDLDEFIVPVSASNVSTWLHDFEGVAGVEIDWLIYGSGGHQKKEPGLVMERFKAHSKFDFDDNKCFKTIINPRSVFHYVTPHHAQHYDGKSVDSHKEEGVGFGCRNPLYDAIRINHYFCKSIEEYHIKMNRGTADGSGVYDNFQFIEDDYNEIKNDPIMDKYIPIVKEKIRQRFNNL
ncbi:hypothetical protein AGMMS49965_24750 [Bacteroidia bacterium]|nr:hypothetical protein AGMMS49965_24750 [Bacteroidia bacterium]